MTPAATTERCRSAISLGWYPGQSKPPAEAPGLHTRCMLDTHEDGPHIGKGLAEFDYQRWQWFTQDRRVYETDRDDEYAWELP